MRSNFGLKLANLRVLLLLENTEAHREKQGVRAEKVREGASAPILGHREVGAWLEAP